MRRWFVLAVPLCFGACLESEYEESWDGDGDGFGDELDCAPDDGAIHPDMLEHCEDGIDNDCDGLVDLADPQCDRASSDTGWSLVSAGGWASCGLARRGELTCWGYYGVRDAPTDDAVYVTAGTSHACSLSPDLEVACWGYAEGFLCVAPPGEFELLAATATFTCALDGEGVVTCWGGFDETDVVDPDPLDGATGFTHLAVGGFGCVLDDAGQATCFFCGEDDESGACSPPSTAFTDIGVAWSYACGLDTDGLLECWGDTPASLDGYDDQVFTRLSADHHQTCGLTDEGRAWCFPGETAEPDDFGETHAPDERFSAIDVGVYHTCALVADDGRVRCWGEDWAGQANPP